MTWNHRQGGSWQTPTPKRRENGQWVTIGGGGDGGGGGGGEIASRFYTDGPPERSGSTITYDGTSYSSLQAAHDDLSAGDTLFIDPSNSPYDERLTLSQSHITIDGGGELSVDSNGTVTVESQGAWLEPSGTGADYVIGRPFNSISSFNSHTTLQSAINNEGVNGRGGESTDGVYIDESTGEIIETVGDDWIDVGDSSHWDVGDWIYVKETYDPFGQPRSGGGGNSDYTQEIRQVTGIDENGSNTITVDYPFLFEFPATNSNEVGHPVWDVEDVHVTGVNLRENPSNGGAEPMKLGSFYNSWFDNMQLENGPDNVIHLHVCNRLRLDKIELFDGNDYGCNISHGSQRIYVTDLVGDHTNRYIIRGGSGGSGHGTPANDILADGVWGINMADKGNSGPVTNVHNGQAFFEFRNVNSDNERPVRPRSYHLEWNGFSEDGGVGATIVCRQRTMNCYIHDGTVTNKQDGVVFLLGPTNTSSYGNEIVQRVIFENIDIEAYDGRDATQIGTFGDETNDGVHDIWFKNVTYGGQPLTLSDVEAWDGYNQIPTSNINVE